MIDFKKLEELVANKEVLKNKHPLFDLYIYSYNRVWYPEWTDELKWARGLVCDANHKVYAYPFKKFFNFGEVKHEVELRADMPYKIQDKADGSLGILFYYEPGKSWIMCTRGSFASEQALKGFEILNEKYPFYTDLDKNYTYLFEIVYSGNRIVVSYKEEDLIALAKINNLTQKEEEFDDPRFRHVETFKELSVEQILLSLGKEYNNSEGYVVTYEDGFKVKFKFDEYIRLHKIVSDFKPVLIVQRMREGINMDEFINSLPDEFRPEIIEVSNRAFKLYAEYFCNYLAMFNTWKHALEISRKEFACKVIELAKDDKFLPRIMFSLADGKTDIANMIWDRIETEI